MSRQTVSRWETGEAEVPPKRRPRLAEVLRTSVGALFGEMGQNVSHETPRPAAVREPRAAYDSGPRWPAEVQALAAKLELRVLEAGGDIDDAQWARRALVSPEQYLRFYRPDQSQILPQVDVLASMEFIASLLFEAATKRQEGKRGSRRADG